MTRLRMNQTQPAILKWLFSWPYGKSFSKADTAPVPMTTANHAGVKCLAAAMRQTMRPKKKKLDCVPNAVWPRLPLFSREKQRLRSLSCCALPTGRHRGTMQQTILWSVVGSDQGPRSGGGRGLARPSVLECGWTYHHHSPGVVPFIRETKIHAEENRRVTGRTNASVPSHQPPCHPPAS